MARRQRRSVDAPRGGSPLNPRTRDAVAGLVQRAWEKIVSLGTIGPGDPRGRRYAAFGPGSAISFPPGGVAGERWIRIGSNTLIGQHVSLAAGMAEEGPLAHTGGDIIVIGDRCNIGRGSSIVGIRSIQIGDDVTTGPNVYITDHNHSYADPHVPITRQWPNEAPVRIGDGCWLGAGAVVLAGATLGRNVTVGAGAVVRGAIPDHSVVAGSPAKVVRQLVDGEWCPPLRGVTARPPPGWND